MPGPLAVAGLSILGGVANNIWNASEARKNRQFQERMSSTAHQREVADLRAANINSAWRSMSGASAPAGDRAEMDDVVSKGVSSAMAAKQMEAQLDLTRAQTDREKVSAMLLQQQRFDLQGGDLAGRGAIAARDLAELSVKERQQLVPLALERAKAEMSQLGASAEAARARAALDSAALAGAKNLEELEKRLGPAGPAVRMLFELLRTLRGAAR